MKKNKFFTYLFLICISLFSCNNDENFEGINKTEIDTNFVDKREAIAQAIMFEIPTDNNLNSTRSTTHLEIDNITPLGNEDKPSYYIVNYKNNSGFTIIAGDKRANSILAFSTKGNFNLDENMPEGLIEWLDNTDTYINQIRITNRSLGQVEDQQIPQEIYPCQSEITQVGPLLKTEWGQWDGYNNNVPKNGCDKPWYNPEGKAPVGCVVVATAQVMRYHEFPRRFNWSAMPNTSGSAQTAAMMRDLGISLDVKYNCDGSGAYVSDIPKTLKDLGYTSAKHKSYSTSDYNLVVSQINAKLPVILGGAKDSGWGIIGVYPKGHAWICDGYYKSQICSDNGTSSTSLFFHMNWGWDNGVNNGWFGYGNWDPHNNNTGYNNRPEIVYDIKL